MSNVLDAVSKHLSLLGITDVSMHYNLSPSIYEQEILKDPENTRSDLGAVMVKTGKFTGRSPKDRYILFHQLYFRL